MTRINTNVSSLTAQKTLARSNAALQQALTRLSTGLRINTGKDDPAGLIASEALRSDITAVGKAISNTQMANQMIATADSSLGQVSSLLNDIRGLVTEAANKGALSDDQIAANQLQIDSSLEAINRIAKNTSFQGKRLLDGSLDFIVDKGTDDDFGKVSAMQIDQANLGTEGEMPVTVNISKAATQGKVDVDVNEGDSAVAATTKINFAGGTELSPEYITVTAKTAGAAANGITIDIVESDKVVSGEIIATWDEENQAVTITVSDDDTTPLAMADIASAIEDIDSGNLFASAVYTQGAAADVIYDPDDEAPAQAVMGDTVAGTDATSGLKADVVFELSGKKGAQVFSFGAGTLGADMETAINSVKDATGVEADWDVGTENLLFRSVDYGSSAFVNVSVIDEGATGVFGSGLSATREEGTDIEATVNGVAAQGQGNKFSLSTATLSMSATMTDETADDDTFDFTITGGGANFQLGPEVVSNQQARMGIRSVSSGSLGGASGLLYELGSGNGAALSTDASLAASIVDEVISQVTALRGRLGAFQKTTLDSNIAALNDTLENLTAAQSSIQDADFAAETANLTRAQILVQSGTSVLAVANQAPQNVLALLRNM